MRFAVSSLSLALAAVTSTGCVSNASERPRAPVAAPARTTPARPVAETATPVTVVAPERRALLPTLRAMGRVVHDRDVKLAFKTGGLIAEVLPEVGDRVEVGQLVARLDPRELDAAVAQASAGVKKARRDLERARGLVKQEVIGAANEQDAETATRVASAQLAGVRFNRETTELRALVSGVVIARLSEPGEVAGPGMPVLVIGVDEGADVPELLVGPPAPPGARSPSVLVEAGFAAREAALIALGDLASITFDEVKPQPVTGVVVAIAPTLTPGTNQVMVTVDVPSPPRTRGLIATAEIEPVRAGQALSVPLSAIVEGDGRLASVFVMNPDGASVTRRPVSITRIAADGQVLLSTGVAATDRVVNTGSAWLEDGARVTVSTDAPASQATP